MKVDCAIIGGGIIGLGVAMTLIRRQPGLKLVVLEKESQVAFHQSGRNSGVIHSGIYYKPGTLKARLARTGNGSLVEFCKEHGIEHKVCGKVIVATNETELTLLENLHRRGLENGLQVTKLSSEEVREVEPQVRCLSAIRVPTTGIVNFRSVCAKYAELIERHGGIVKTSVAVMKIDRKDNSHLLETATGEIEAGFLINCGGLHSDRIARQAGLHLESRMVPFRGEYYELVPERRQLVNALIYPVPDPAFPFLGAHFTKAIDGSVHVGPNAVLAFQREGYHKCDVSFIDLLETLTYRGFWKLVRTHYSAGLLELYRSISKKAFLANLQRLIPEIIENDLIPGRAGVRAQALRPDGKLLDDFLIMRGTNAIHVCNAPSPAATASIEIAKAVANQIPELQRAVTISLAGAGVCAS